MDIERTVGQQMSLYFTRHYKVSTLVSTPVHSLEPRGTEPNP